MNVRSLRSAHGLTIKELAKELGVTERSIYRWEQSGVKPSNLAAERLQEFQQAAGPTRVTATLASGASDPKAPARVRPDMG